MPALLDSPTVMRSPSASAICCSDTTNGSWECRLGRVSGRATAFANPPLARLLLPFGLRACSLVRHSCRSPSVKNGNGPRQSRWWEPCGWYERADREPSDTRIGRRDFDMEPHQRSQPRPASLASAIVNEPSRLDRQGRLHIGPDAAACPPATMSDKHHKVLVQHWNSDEVSSRAPGPVRTTQILLAMADRRLPRSAVRSVSDRTTSADITDPEAVLASRLLIQPQDGRNGRQISIETCGRWSPHPTAAAMSPASLSR